MPKTNSDSNTIIMWIIVWLFLWPILLPIWLLKIYLEHKTNKNKQNKTAKIDDYDPPIRPDQLDLRTDICPYCGEKLKKVPEARTKCPHCSKFIYVINTLENTRITVTKDNASKIRFDKSFNRLRNWAKIQAFIEPQDKICDYLDSTRKKWDESRRKYSIKDLEYSLYHYMIELGVKSSPPNNWGVSYMYRELAKIDESEGRDPTRFLKESDKYSKLAFRN